MALYIPSKTELKELLTNARWTLKLIWSTNAPVTAGLIVTTLVRGIVPAGLALFARGLINAFVNHSGDGAAGMDAVLPWLLLGFGFTAVEALGPLAEKFFSQRLRDDVNIKIASDVLSHAATLGIAFFENPAKRNIIDRAQKNPTEYFMSFVLESQRSMTSLLQTLSLAGVLIMVEPLVLWVLVPCALPYLYFQWRLSKQRYEEEYSRTPQRRWTTYFVSLLTSRHSVTEIRLLGLAPYLVDKFRSLMTQFRDRDKRLHLRSFGASSIFGLVTTVAFYLIFVRVILNALAGALTVGDIAVFIAATSRIRYTLETAIRSLSTGMEQTLYISNLIEFFNEKPRSLTGPAVIPAPARGEVEFKNVSFSYPDSTEPALCDVSLHIRPGETVAVVGENGAGKTTLVKLLARIYDPDEGRIEFDGIDVKSIPTDYIHRRIGFVLQDFASYEATAADNIAYGDWRTLVNNRAKVEQVGCLAGVDGMIQSMPAGYDTVLGRLFGERDLSKGQWQRLAIARAFARDATVLILDEPASSLSVQAEYELFCRFHELSRGRTTILISHRFSTLSIADRIIVMEKGRIIECGTHQELLNRAGSYARLYRLHRHPLKSMASHKTAGGILPLK